MESEPQLRSDQCPSSRACCCPPHLQSAGLTLAQLRSGQRASTRAHCCPRHLWSAGLPLRPRSCSNHVPIALWKWNRLSDAPFALSHECFAHAFFGKFITLISLSMSAYTQMLQCACGGQRTSWGLGAFLLPCGLCCRLNSCDQAWWQVPFLLGQIV